MNATRLFWLCVWAGNLLLALTAGIWWRAGWRWALIFLVVGPCAMVGMAVWALVLFFFLDGGVAKEVPCEGGCGRPAPLQLRGQRYRRPLCDACERARHEAHTRARQYDARAPETWKL